MNPQDVSYRLCCVHCRADCHCDFDQMVGRLRQLGMLKRDKKPAADLVVELFTSVADRLSCSECGGEGMTASPAEEMSGAAWPSARLCEACREPIRRERLEALPEATLCAACRSKEEAGEVLGEVEYCPRCGSAMSIAQRGGRGITRYAMICPTCGQKA